MCYRYATITSATSCVTTYEYTAVGCVTSTLQFDVLRDVLQLRSTQLDVLRVCYSYKCYEMCYNLEVRCSWMCYEYATVTSATRCVTTYEYTAVGFVTSTLLLQELRDVLQLSSTLQLDVLQVRYCYKCYETCYNLVVHYSWICYKYATVTSATRCVTSTFQLDV